VYFAQADSIRQEIGYSDHILNETMQAQEYEGVGLKLMFERRIQLLTKLPTSCNPFSLSAK